MTREQTAPESPNGAITTGAASAVLREREPAGALVASEGADEESGPAGSPPRRETEPGATSDAPVSSDAVSAQSGARLAAAPAQDVQASTGTETEEASLYLPRGAMPPPLRGSLESLERQNERLEAEGLERIQDETDLASRIADGMLVPVPASESLVVNADLPPTHRYCRPWTAQFLADLAHAHEAAFHRPIEVSSAVRTVEYQRRLMETNGNAAPAEGDVVSPHETGATVDIAKKGLSWEEMSWMRKRLLALEDAGKIDVEEEFHQACFHITVYKNYAPAKTPRSPLKATSPTNRTRHQPEPATAGTEAATTGL